MIIKSFVRSQNNVQHFNNFRLRSKTKLKAVEPLQGIEIGIPLNIFSNIFTFSNID